MISRLALLCTLVIVPMSARAADSADLLADDDDDLFATPTKSTSDVPDASAFNTNEPDIDIPAAPIKVEPKPEPPKGPATKLPLDLGGKTPLADNWAPQIVITDVDSVVIEIPVLYANAGAGFDGTAYWLVAEVYADGVKVSESRAQVSKETVSPKGPSVQFFRLFAPVPGKTGVLEVKVSRLATTAAAKPSLVISRSVNYSLPG